MRADAPGVDPGALALQVGYQVFIEFVGRHYHRVGEAGLREHPVGVLAEPGQIAGVEAYGRPHVVARRPQLPEHGERIREAGGERVVGVDQQQAVVREERGVRAECGQFVLEAHDP